MRNLIYIGICVLVLFLASCNSNQKSGESVIDNSLEMEENAQYSLSDISEHSSEDDCWMAIDGRVYDVTGFVAAGKHGAAILQGCGIDGTSLYSTRPMGSGTDHSSKAYEMLEEYYIGDLK